VFTIAHFFKQFFVVPRDFDESGLLGVRTDFQAGLDDLVALHVLHEVDDLFGFEADQADQNFAAVFIGPLLETLLDHVGAVLLSTEVEDVVLDDCHHPVLVLLFALLEDVLDDLVALLVFAQLDHVVHDLLLDLEVQLLGRNALNHFLDHAAAQRVHAEVLGVVLEVVENLVQRLNHEPHPLLGLLILRKVLLKH